MNKVSVNKPAIAVWEATLKCNLQCAHCGSSAGATRADELSTTEALHLCHDLAALGCTGVALMGGEIFLRQDWLTISKEIKRQGMVLSVITNGFIDADSIIPQLSAIGTDCVMIGLDGGSAESHDAIRGVQGSFEKACTFLKEAKKAHLRTGAITTVQKSNFHELPTILKKGPQRGDRLATPRRYTHRALPSQSSAHGRAILHVRPVHPGDTEKICDENPCNHRDTQPGISFVTPPQPQRVPPVARMQRRKNRCWNTE